jgi:hypothetical protein
MSVPTCGATPPRPWYRGGKPVCRAREARRRRQVQPLRTRDKGRWQGGEISWRASRPRPGSRSSGTVTLLDGGRRGQGTSTCGWRGTLGVECAHPDTATGVGSDTADPPSDFSERAGPFALGRVECRGCSPYLMPSVSPECFFGSGGHQACRVGRLFLSSYARRCRPAPAVPTAGTTPRRGAAARCNAGALPRASRRLCAKEKRRCELLSRVTASGSTT